MKDVYRIAAEFVPCVLSEGCEFLATNKMCVVPPPLLTRFNAMGLSSVLKLNLMLKGRKI